jgi:small subunit ribosomal protein S3
MYFGGTIMTFALPYGAFIAAALALYFLFRARHSGPRLRYLSSAQVASVTTREPGPAPAPSVLPAGPETAVAPGTLLPETAAPETAAPETTAPETTAPEAPAAETDGGEE